MNPTGPTAQRFPLVARPRPACSPLRPRIADLAERARAADRENSATGASAVFNLAALLASDIGMPELARQLCHRHVNAYLRTGRPLNAEAARNALEPLVNLARLATRAGNGEHAYRLLDDLYTAVTTRTDTTIDGTHVPAGNLTDSDHAHAEVRHWLWTVHLATGTRALTSAGLWHEAEDHLRAHNGIGHRMLDGRQVAVLARATAGEADAALALLRTTTPGNPWENAVTACLTALCTDTPTPGTPHLIDYHRKLNNSHSLTVFRTRLGLNILDAHGTVKGHSVRGFVTELLQDATMSNDGYAAQDLLTHARYASLLTSPQKQRLATLVHNCGFGHCTLPNNLDADLSAALDFSEAVLTRNVTGNGSARVRIVVLPATQTPCEPS
ncbi:MULTISPECIES: hypothetical protein [unclassified Streptomyces]|uniref:hypothetical protein n=1 Tax=unclassified Streptomyces TaxID=2593676 RepID=UPI0015E16405|nr:MULTISPECIES: hypothetical protein [unclassified Streptomyces]